MGISLLVPLASGIAHASGNNEDPYLYLLDPAFTDQLPPNNPLRDPAVAKAYHAHLLAEKELYKHIIATLGPRPQMTKEELYAESNGDTVIRPDILAYDERHENLKRTDLEYRALSEKYETLRNDYRTREKAFRSAENAS